jgi:hypothetical protein
MRFRACRSLHLPLEDDERHAQEGVFRHKLRPASASVCQGLEREGGSQWRGLLKKARSQSSDERTHEPLETRKNPQGLLLQEEREWYLWQGEHLFSPSPGT